MTRQTSDQRPIWCGIHYLLYLRRPGEERDCARLSLFQTEYSPGGGGHAAFLYLDPASLRSAQAVAGAPGMRPQKPPAPVNAVYTDNPDMAGWLYNRMYRDGDNPLAECGEAVVTARFGRSGDMRRRLRYSIDTAQSHITATWGGLEPPFVHHGLGGRSTVYTYCFFVVAARASLVVNGEAAPGEIYLRQDWVPLVGRPLSSCLIGDEFWATP